MISTGHIAVLVSPITDDDVRQELSEKMYNGDSILDVNYEGTLLTSDINRHKPYSQREFNGDLFVVGALPEADKQEFIELAKAAGLDIDVATIQPYTCVWYNGADSPVSMLEKDEFLKN